jgi:hypothetical protein
VAEAFAFAPQPSGLIDAHPPMNPAMTTAPSVASKRRRVLAVLSRATSRAARGVARGLTDPSLDTGVTTARVYRYRPSADREP